MSTSQTTNRDDHASARSTDLAARTVAPGQTPDLSVIVPTRNEAGNIGSLLARLGDALSGIAAEVLVVDDSDDATPGIALRASHPGTRAAAGAAARRPQRRTHLSRPPRRIEGPGTPCTTPAAACIHFPTHWLTARGEAEDAAGIPAAGNELEVALSTMTGS
jgi:hypothetical protein